MFAHHPRDIRGCKSHFGQFLVGGCRIDRVQVTTLVKRMGFKGRDRAHRSKQDIESKEAVYDGHWNMIAQSGLPANLISQEIRAAAEYTCRECELYRFADRTSCRDCPAVVLLKKIIEARP